MESNIKIYYAIIGNPVTYRIPEYHGQEVCDQVIKDGGIKINQELHTYLISLGSVTFQGVVQDKVYTIADKSLFNQVVQQVDSTPQPPSQEQRIAALEELMMGVI